MRLFQRGKRGTWWGEYRDPVTGREVRQSLRVTSKRKAEHLAREKEEQVARRHHRLTERKPWAEAVTAFLAYGEVQKERVTVAEDRRTLQGAPAKGKRPARAPRFVLPGIVRFVDEVRADHVAAYVAARKALGRSPFRINRELRTLRALFNWCAAPSRRWVVENPAREVPQLPEPQGVAARCMTDDQIGALVKAVEGTRLEGPVLLALNHGLRQGELIHIRRESVDLGRGVVWVRHDPLSKWKVKNKHERVIPLNEVTQDWLTEYLEEPKRDLSPCLFASETGGPMSREYLVKLMGRTMRGIGITRGGFHMLRHTWASKQSEAGTPNSVLKAMGGWRDWRSMEKYQHIGDQAQRDASARVVIGPASLKVTALSVARRRKARGGV